MTVLIRVLDERGNETRRCDGRCHRAKPGGESRCVCGGLLRGCERGDREIDWAFVQYVRETVTLHRGEIVQMEIGL